MLFAEPKNKVLPNGIWRFNSTNVASRDSYHILIDDVGFGDLGIPELNAILGYKTPNINKLAEVLSESGYNTVHIGKWHMGDIMESWPNHQGFDYASFPIHQQGQLTIFNDDAADEEVSIGIGKNNYDDRFTLDKCLPKSNHKRFSGFV